MAKAHLKEQWDRFAAAALSGLLSDPQNANPMSVNVEVAAGYADAMLEERAKRTKRGGLLGEEK